MSSLFRRGTSQSEKSPEVELKEVLIPTYELDWGDLKSWLDGRFKSYNCTFTKRYNVVRLRAEAWVGLCADTCASQTTNTWCTFLKTSQMYVL
jgi:hypothetical protein